MGQLGIYVERYTISSSDEMNALLILSQVARRLGHRVDFLFRPDMYKIPEYDAIYIRALTDPLNSAYVAARTAEMHGVKVIDDPSSILICCDKVNMYGHLIKNKVPIPDTQIISRKDMNSQLALRLFQELGSPLVLKAPNSSFSKYVEKASTVDEFLTIGQRFFRRADRIVAQRFVQSSFDWRVGVLDSEPIYVCKYVIPKKRWKILTHTEDGRTVFGQVKSILVDKAPTGLIECAIKGAQAIGNGLYGVDLKQVGNDFVVIEVNDNPTINYGEEDNSNGDLYERLINVLLPKKE